MDKAALRKLATGSGAHRWMNCPGSVALSFGMKEKEKDYARRGTVTHDIGAKAITENTDSSEIKDDAARAYVDFVRQIEPRGGYHVEERLPFIGSSGQIDCYAFESPKTITLFDLKAGEGLRVVAAGNYQLAFYAGALKEKYPTISKVNAYIIQPNIDGDFVDTPNITQVSYVTQTLSMWKRRFEAGLREVEKAEKLKMGEWCRFCPAVAKCPLYQSHTEITADGQENFPVPVQNKEVISIDKLAALLAQKKRVTKWFEKAEEYLLGLALAGVKVPGFGLENKRTHRQWMTMLSEEDVAFELEHNGIEPYTRELISVAEAERRGNIDALRAIIEKPIGELTLKLRNDKE